MMQLVSIIVNKLVYIHIFYDEDRMIVFDPADSVVVEKARTAKITKNLYKADEFKSLDENKQKREILAVFCTHRHKNNIGGIDKIQSGKKIIGKPDKKTTKKNNEGQSKNPKQEGYSVKDAIYAKDNEDYEFDEIKVKAISTPCHTRDSYCYYVTGMRVKYLITGDTILFLGVGKFFQGSAKDLQKNIDKIESRIDNSTLMLYGHDYKEKNLKNISEYSKLNPPKDFSYKNFLTFAEEKQYNPYLNLDIAKTIGKTDEEKLNFLRAKKDYQNPDTEN